MINLLGGAHRIAIPTHMWCEKSSVLKEPHPNEKAHRPGKRVIEPRPSGSGLTSSTRVMDRSSAGQTTAMIATTKYTKFGFTVFSKILMFFCQHLCIEGNDKN